MAAMLLMVAGVKSWSVDNDKVQKFAVSKQLALHDVAGEGASQLPDTEQAKVSSLSLDAVITPAISFDFSHYFYFSSQPVWSFVQKESILETAFTTPIYLFTSFSRIFGRYIVTNAP